MVKVKICGITNEDDALKACGAGADYLGFIFVPGTPRFVAAETAAAITLRIRKEFPAVGLVGLFKDEEISRVSEISSACGFDHVQLHGDESPGYCSGIKERTGVKILKVFKVGAGILPVAGNVPDDYGDADLLVFDTYCPGAAGGTGTRFSWDVLVKARDNLEKPFFIAGGLDPGNVSEAVATVRPYGVDVSSGTEKSPGKKDEKLLKEFIDNAKKDQTAGQ